LALSHRECHLDRADEASRHDGKGPSQVEVVRRGHRRTVYFDA